MAEGYDEVARRHPDRVRVIDADADRDAVHAAVLAEVQALSEGVRRSDPLDEDGSGGEQPAIPPALAEATRHQPRARAALAAALASPAHAYIFRGPRGSGKAAAARAFAAELLAEGAPDPDDARRRALLDPSPHPDLVWLRPPGAQHLVEDVRESVIRAASLSPAEGRRRVFVIEEAEDLRDESQNALLKTLEEPAPFAHLILICSEPEQLAETILSRCTPIEFGPAGAGRGARGAGGGRRGGRGRPPQRRRRGARPARLLGERGRGAPGHRRGGRAGPTLGGFAPPSPGASCSRPPERPASRRAPRRSAGCSRRPRRPPGAAARGS